MKWMGRKSLRSTVESPPWRYERPTQPPLAYIHSSTALTSELSLEWRIEAGKKEKLPVQSWVSIKVHLVGSIGRMSKSIQ